MVRQAHHERLILTASRKVKKYMVIYLAIEHAVKMLKTLAKVADSVLPA